MKTHPYGRDMNYILIFLSKVYENSKTLTAVTFITFLNMSVAQGVELNIRAEFKPDPAAPYLNKFENKTPVSGYCLYNPSDCVNTGMFSLRAPIAFTSTHPIIANHSDPRQGAVFNIPTQWRELFVTHVQTGQQETLRIRITGFGSQYRSSQDIRLLVNGGLPGIDSFPAHYMLWVGGRWNAAPSPCQAASNFNSSYNQWDYVFFWKTTVQAPCKKQAQFNIPEFRYNYTDFAYEIETPNPLGMATGDYLGNYIYTLGPGKDFDMGDVMIPNDPVLSLNFTLNVQHTLKVLIPSGGQKVELLPRDGWQQWVNTGRNPEKLYRDQTAVISASSRFKMQLACEQVSGDTCAISNGSHAVPVDVMVSLPNGIGNEDGSAVNFKPLGIAAVQIFEPTFYVDSKPSTLHFEIKKVYVEEMLLRQGKYSGNITVIWDSEL